MVKGIPLLSMLRSRSQSRRHKAGEVTPWRKKPPHNCWKTPLSQKHSFSKWKGENEVLEVKSQENTVVSSLALNWCWETPQGLKHLLESKHVSDLGRSSCCSATSFLAHSSYPAEGQRSSTTPQNTGNGQNKSAQSSDCVNHLLPPSSHP